ncbi:MAG TPA: DHA2 family efflux MFS transporter permease subunit [Candidatus Saccharimonadales bacterium]|nr:DHA2 family efflux MFS transporter permease subunit [Candidatus Saccharimonadales bacterium]
MSESGATKWIIAGTVVLASMIELIDTSIVNVALTQMMGNLGATLDEIAWVVTAYVVGNVIVVPMTGWLSAYFGRRNYFAASIALFTVASVLCGHASSLWELVFFRFVQGLGGGALLSTSQAILVETFPPAQIGLATALFGMGVVTGPTLGPVLGGWITDNLSWPWIFYVNIPIGIVAALLTLTFIQNSRYEHNTSVVDWWGIGLLAAGVGSLQVVLERGEREDWFSSRFIVTLAIVAAVGLVAFVWRELTTAHPVVNLRVLRNRALATGTLLTFVLGFGLFGSVFLFPVFAQTLLGFTAMQTGMTLLPSGIMTALMMPFVGRLVRRHNAAPIMVAVGFTLFAVFCWMVSHSTLQSGEMDFFNPLLIRGLGLSLVFVPITTRALRSLRGTEIAQGAGLTNMMRQLGGSVGVAVMATYVQQRGWVHREYLLEHLSGSDPAVRARLDAMIHGFMAHGVTFFDAQAKAYAALEATLSRQTFLLSCMDAFRTVGVGFLLCLPLLLLFVERRKQAEAEPVRVHLE